MKKFTLMFLIFTSIISSFVEGQTWNGSINSDWNTAANWTPSGVPGAASSVIINNASLTWQPSLSGDVTIASINMSKGTLNLNGFTITCSGAASFWGDSLLNGKVVAASFSQVTNMRLGGKIILDKTGAINNAWSGNNKVFNDSMIVIWRSGTLHLETSGPDSIFSNLKFQAANNNGTISFSEAYPLYVRDNLILDNTGNGTFSWASAASNTIGGNLVSLNFSKSTTHLYLKNITTLGNNENGPFNCLTGSISGCSFNGNFTLRGDSSQTFVLNNSSFLGADNLFQAGSLEFQNNLFGQKGNGTTILRAAHNVGAGVYMRDGNNKFLGDAQFETYAAFPGGLTIQQTYYGQDTCLGNLSFILKGNAALLTNGNGNSFVAGNVIIDGQGADKWVQFTGGAGISFNIGGNLTAKNFTPHPLAGVGSVNLFLRNITAGGTDTCGTFYCFTGDARNSVFNGNINIIGDSSQTFALNNSSFLGADNLFQAGSFDFQNNLFGQKGNGTTILRAAHNLVSGVYMRDGNNTFFGDTRWEANPAAGSLLIQQTYYGKDSCFGNFVTNLSGFSSINLGGNNLYLAKGLALNNNGTGTIAQNISGSAIHFIGSDTSDYKFSGTGSHPSLLNIEMNRSGGLRLQSPLSFTGTLSFTLGIIISSATNPLNIPNGVVATSAWDSSYVDGPVLKTGNSAFTFPVGGNNRYAPISITAPASVSDVFSAQYFNSNANDAGYDTSRHEIMLDHLSRKEYWLLSRINGASAPKVTLSWDTTRSGGVETMADLRVAHWDGSAWKDEGNGGTTGTNAAGTVQTLNYVTSFSPFTLASVTVDNALPVSFLSFTASVLPNRSVLLHWVTSEEINNAYFEVQRSTDAVNWNVIRQILPAASHEYSAIDNTIHEGTYNYRIRQVDKDGNGIYSIVKVLNITGDNKLYFWPNPVSGQLFIQTGFSRGSIEITDAIGHVVWKKRINNTVTTIPVQHLARGLFIVKVIKYDGSVFTEKFIKN